MNENEILIEELRSELRRSTLLLKTAKSVVNDCLSNYDSETFDADAWDSAAHSLLEDIDMFVTKAE